MTTPCAKCPNWDLVLSQLEIMFADRAEVIDTVYNHVAAMREADGDHHWDVFRYRHCCCYPDCSGTGRPADLLYEEPAHPLNVENYAQIKAETDIPIATGERVYTRQGYRPFFEKRLIDVIQPDLCLCGGLTETKKSAIWPGLMIPLCRFMFAVAQSLRRLRSRSRRRFPTS